MISINNLGKSFGARSLFEKVGLKLSPGSRYGLVGSNGCGKTTFLRILAGDEAATDGNFSMPPRSRLGVLRQDRFLADDAIIIELTMQGDSLVWGAMQELQALTESEIPNADRLTELEDIIRSHDGYTLEARATEVLEGLGIPRSSHKMTLQTLSGGFKLRVLLAQVLLEGPDILLLDEPTNHLDILSIRWLEKFLAQYKGCAVVISHDQRFLDNIATHILDMDYGTVTRYVGNYSTFAIEKQSVRERKEAEIERVQDIIAEKQAFVDRFRYKATKARQAQSRLKQIEKIEVEVLADSSRRSPMFRFDQERPSGRDAFELIGISKAYGEKQVLNDVSLAVRRGEKVGIIGPNGLGKSTLLRILVERLDADAGTIRLGHEVKIGYFPQDHKEILDSTITPYQFIETVCPKDPPSFIRGQLGRMLFSGEDVNKDVSALSGGECARLLFCKLTVEKPNLLILDEPTNHLDLEAIGALVEAIQAFEGTVVFVSHDRAFVSRTATRIVEVTPTGLRDFPGTYSEYLERCGDDHLDSESVALKDKRERKEKETQSSAVVPTGDWELQKRERNRRKELPARRDRLLKDIDAAEADKQRLVEKQCSPGYYETTLKQDVQVLNSELATISKKIDSLIEEWEAVEGEIAAQVT